MISFFFIKGANLAKQSIIYLFENELFFKLGVGSTKWVISLLLIISERSEVIEI